ncbi:FAD/NAD(P)-binding domain-containing protein [Xylariomycetidae sp. FL0641]|nr:FAD/NAD(P)-binding domain-containing protein [Xylariomycetidae sp. FL0641]
MSTTEPAGFRAIIVGGGPTGLTAAHALGRAGIDFVMLEARDTVVPEAGSSLVLYPSTMRVFYQLGLKKAAEAASTRMTTNSVVTRSGKQWHQGAIGQNFTQLHGLPPMIFHRRDLLHVLYQNLHPGWKERVLTKQKVVGMESNSDGVVVRCADGSEYRGSIVIGADGVYSKTRNFMRSLALQRDGQNAEVNEEKPYIATYRCMWGNIPPPKGLPMGANQESHGSTQSSMFIHSPERSWFFIYELLEKPTKERRDYTEEDMEAFARRTSDMHLAPGLTFGDVWPTRNDAGMSNLDEGILEHWSWDRIVLVGDAVHKVTPNIGWGYNSGIQDVAALSNLLHDTLKAKETEKSEGAAAAAAAAAAQPSVEELTKIFAEYAAVRKPVMGPLSLLSSTATRQCAVPRTLSRLLYGFLELLAMIPGFEYFMTRHVAGRYQCQGLVLNYLGGEELRKGLVSWVHPIRPVISVEG